MKAIEVLDERLVWKACDRPDCGPGEVLVRVHAAGVNRADLVQRAGRYAPPPGASQIMGLECAGEVVETGDDVNRDWVGKRVCALLTGGGYAEYVNVPVGQLIPMHDNMSYETAAAIPEAYMTAFINVFLEPNLQPGESILLHAVASGVGIAAVQLCAGEYPIIGVCSGSKHSEMAQFAVTRLIDRHTESFEEIVKEMGGVDVILDPVGGPNLQANLGCLKRRGRLVNIGLLGGREATFNMGVLLVKRLQIIGSVLRARSVEEKRSLVAAFVEQHWDRFESEIAPVMHGTIPIAEADEAHRILQANENIGKVVLRISE